MNHLSRMTALRSRRERRVERQDTLTKAVYNAVSTPEAGYTRRRTADQVLKARAVRRKWSGPVRRFENSSAAVRGRRTRYICAKKMYARLSAIEKQCIKQAAPLKARPPPPPSVPPLPLPLPPLPLPLSPPPVPPPLAKLRGGFCDGCQRHHFSSRCLSRGQLQPLEHCPNDLMPVIPIHTIGHAGTGVGSTFRGHCRRGGSKSRKRHARTALAVVVDEFKTTKVCSYCLARTRLARQRRVI
ncbi:unnamed protein product [Mortierella alpina]